MQNNSNELIFNNISTTSNNGSKYFNVNINTNPYFVSQDQEVTTSLEAKFEMVINNLAQVISDFESLPTAENIDTYITKLKEIYIDLNPSEESFFKDRALKKQKLMLFKKEMKQIKTNFESYLSVNEYQELTDNDTKLLKYYDKLMTLGMSVKDILSPNLSEEFNLLLNLIKNSNLFFVINTRLNRFYNKLDEYINNIDCLFET